MYSVCTQSESFYLLNSRRLRVTGRSATVRRCKHAGGGVVTVSVRCARIVVVATEVGRFRRSQEIVGRHGRTVFAPQNLNSDRHGNQQARTNTNNARETTIYDGCIRRCVGYNLPCTINIDTQNTNTHRMFRVHHKGGLFVSERTNDTLLRFR